MVNDPTSIRKHSVFVAGHETSISLENAFWDGLTSIASQQDLSINDLVAKIDIDRHGNLSSAIRLYVLKNIKN